MASVLLGMSGGVDSSVAAELLLRAGYEVTGATLVMHDIHELDAEAAREVAKALGIPHVTVDMREEFEKCVLAPFVAEYEKGRTPNPCVLCNGYIKFPALLKAADGIGCDYIATGHYAAVGAREGHPVITAATDRAKDQSYFLYMLGEDILSRPRRPPPTARTSALSRISPAPISSEAVRPPRPKRAISSTSMAIFSAGTRASPPIRSVSARGSEFHPPPRSTSRILMPRAATSSSAGGMHYIAQESMRKAANILQASFRHHLKQTSVCATQRSRAELP